MSHKLATRRRFCGGCGRTVDGAGQYCGEACVSKARARALADGARAEPRAYVPVDEADRNSRDFSTRKSIHSPVVKMPAHRYSLSDGSFLRDVPYEEADMLDQLVAFPNDAVTLREAIEVLTGERLDVIADRLGCAPRSDHDLHRWSDEEFRIILRSVCPA